MNNTMEYKGYVGSVEFSEEDVIFYGKVMGIRSLISYEGENARELVEGFHEAVDEFKKQMMERDFQYRNKTWSANMPDHDITLSID